VVIKVQELDRDDAKQHRDERSGYHRSQTAKRQDDSERECADEQRRALGVAQMDDDVPQLLEEVAAALLDAEELRDLANDDRRRQPDDEALDHRLGDEARHEPQAQDTGQQRSQAGGDRQGAVIAVKRSLPTGASAATVAADSAAVADIGPASS
jgi:hypothetical protein